VPLPLAEEFGDQMVEILVGWAAGNGGVAVDLPQRDGFEDRL